MSDTTLEEARRCPRCKEPGRLLTVMPPREGPGKVNVYVCENTRCVSEDGRWIVQILPDGTIPVRQKGEKEFPEMSASWLASGQRQVEDAVQQDLRERERETG